MSALLPTPWEPVGNRSVRCAFEAGNAEKPGFEVATVPMFLPSDEAERVARLIGAGPDLLAAIKPLLRAVDDEIEQRKTSGNDEYWEGLQWLSNAGHAAVARAEGR